MNKPGAELQRRGAVRVCESTIRAGLRVQGIVRLIAKRKGCEAPGSGKAGHKRYGYTAAHRRQTSLQYSTDLTDAQWALVANLFERAAGQRGTPARYERRELVKLLGLQRDFGHRGMSASASITGVIFVQMQQ